MIRFLISILFFANLSFAEIYNCGGTWSNKPCKGEVLQKIDEVQHKPRSKEDLDRDQKKLIIHDLQTLKFKGERESGLNFMISDLVAFCRDEKTPLAECSDKAHEKVESINRNLTELRAKQLAEKEKDSSKSETDNSKVNISVPGLIDPFFDRFHWYRPHRPKPEHPHPHKPVVTPPTNNTPPPPLPPRKGIKGKIVGIQ